jgi:hypothetical protein
VTLAPSAANLIAVARPIPLPLPVTIAVFPSIELANPIIKSPFTSRVIDSPFIDAANILREVFPIDA